MGGTWTVTDAGYVSFFEGMFETPWLWFMFSFALFIGFKVAYEHHLFEFKKTAGMANNANLILDCPILNKSKFEDYIMMKKARAQTVIHADPRATQHHFYSWVEEDPEEWPGMIVPTITVEYDWVKGYLLTINIAIPRLPGAVSPKGAREIILDELR